MRGGGRVAPLTLSPFQVVRIFAVEILRPGWKAPGPQDDRFIFVCAM
jgi:hypothetical protein